MPHMYVKVFKVSGCYNNKYSIYVKLYWYNKKYKTREKFWTSKFNEEFLLPIPEGTKDDDKLFVELWQCRFINTALAKGYIKYKDIKESWVNKPLKVFYWLTQCYIHITAMVVADASDNLYNKMADMFPFLPAIRIKEAIAAHATEDLIICQLRNIEQGNTFYNMHPCVAALNQPGVSRTNAMLNYNTEASPEQAYPLVLPEDSVANPIMTIDAVDEVANSKSITIPSRGRTHFIGIPSPYSQSYLYRSPFNKKKALLIGVNYYGTKHALQGCANDTARMKNILITKYGFRDTPTTMLRLIDNDSDPNYRPTKKNILAAMAWLTANNRKGDVFFFLFSGHGSRRRDWKHIEEDGYNETILPCDHQQEGEIVDDDLHRYLVQPLNSGVKLIAVVDCCRSGTCLDLAFEYKIKKKKWTETKNPFHVLCDVSQFSSCRDDELSYEVDNEQNLPGGSLVSSLIHVLNSTTGSITYDYLLHTVNDYMCSFNTKQSITFMSSQQFPVNNRFFDFDSIVENKNRKLGQIMNYVSPFRRK